MAAASIKLGLSEVLEMGNLDAKLDWGYAVDHVEAMWRMLQADVPEEYVIGTGKLQTVRELVAAAFDCVGDACIMPSQEGFGIVYLEAMACGVPVLAGDADGSADPLQDGRLGWQVPHRDPEAMAAACIEILKGGDK